MCQIKYWLLIATFFSNVVFAQIVARCQFNNFKIQHSAIILNITGKPQQSYFLIKNHSTAAIILNRQAQVSSMNAGWASRLDPNHNTILAITRSHFKLICQSPKNYQAINCQTFISVCHYPNQKKIIGNYWLAENIVASDIKKIFQKRHILLR